MLATLVVALVIPGPVVIEPFVMPETESAEIT
jgi:hypothetical protein